MSRTTAPPVKQGRATTFHVAVRLLRYARRRPWAAMLVVLGVLLQALVVVLQPWPLKVLVDNVLAGQPVHGWLATFVGNGIHKLLALVVVSTVAIYMATWAAGMIGSWSAIAFGRRLTWDIAADLFDRLQRDTLRMHSKRGTGDAIRRVTVDSEAAAHIVQDALLPSASAVVTLVAVAAVMIRVDPELALVSAVVAPCLFVVIHHYAGMLTDTSLVQQEAEAQMYDTVEEALAGAEVIQAFQREAAVARTFRADAARALTAVRTATAVQLRFKVWSGLATAAGAALVMWVGGRQIIDHQLSVGTLLVFVAYLASLYTPIESIVYGSSTVQSAKASAWRVLEVLDADPEVADRPGARPVASVRGDVRFEGVTFGYEAGRPVLHDVSFHAHPGETLAVVGPTGAGKTTLMGLALRLHDPWNGRVTLDGADLRDLQLAGVRSSVALVLQDTFLFPVTIAENIAYGRPDADQPAIEAAARAANAHEFITALPDSYRTVIGDRGATLSGGERQRIAIARAVLKNAPILILDEPTSALDAHTEASVVDALSRLMTGRTSLIIAHRLSTIRNVDRIIVVDQGRIIETGTPTDLLATNSRYAALHALSTGTAR